MYTYVKCEAVFFFFVSIQLLWSHFSFPLCWVLANGFAGGLREKIHANFQLLVIFCLYICICSSIAYAKTLILLNIKWFLCWKWIKGRSDVELVCFTCTESETLKYAIIHRRRKLISMYSIVVIFVHNWPLSTPSVFILSYYINVGIFYSWKKKKKRVNFIRIMINI